MDNRKYKSYKHGSHIEATPHPIITSGTYSDWYPGKDEQTVILSNNNITTNWEYRQFMTRSGSVVMNDTSHRANEFHYSTVPTRDGLDERGVERRNRIAGTVVGRSNGESGDLRSQYLHTDRIRSSQFTPKIIFNQPTANILPYNNGN
jgi:hypothetical protein